MPEAEEVRRKHALTPAYAWIGDGLYILHRLKPVASGHG